MSLLSASLALLLSSFPSSSSLVGDQYQRPRTGQDEEETNPVCCLSPCGLIIIFSFSFSPGGGWQDQVGGLVGGVKVGRSRASLPLQVEVERLRPPEDFLVSLEQHLLLVYTGKTRLARNLLQVGIRLFIA